MVRILLKVIILKVVAVLRETVPLILMFWKVVESIDLENKEFTPALYVVESRIL